jgi:hypothetical protein
MALTPHTVAELNENVKKLLDLWMRTRLVFIKAFGNQPIDDAQENAYLELKSEIQRLYRTISENITSGLMFDGDKMIETMKNAISMDQLRQQAAKERQSYLATWHQIYIRLTRTLGALEVINAGYYPHEHRSMLQSYKDAGKGKSKSRKK